jgi:hypothetical protein
MKFFLIFCFTIISFHFSIAQWKFNDPTPSSVCAAPNFQYAVLYSIDDEGNSFYVWADYRDDLIDLYAQKLDSKGTPQWTKDGLRIGRILDKSTFIYTPKVIKPDGKGGAYIAWHRCIDVNKTERRNLYAQYVSSDGKTQWAADGVKVTEQELTSYDPNDGVMELNDLKSDKLLFTFNNYNATSTTNVVYAKKLSYAGKVIEAETKLFEAKGLETKVFYDEKSSRFIALIKDAAADYLYQTFDATYKAIISATAFYQNPFSGTTRIDMFKTDNDGNAIIGRTLTGSNQRVVIAHKVGKDGKTMWGNNGINLGSNTAFDVQVVPTSDGGGIATWIDTGDKAKPFQKAKINASGNIVWRKEVFTPRSDKSYFLPNKLVPDGKDGVYTLWLKPKDIGYDLTIQHLDANGEPRFGEDGVAIKDYTFYSDYRLIPHPKGGVIVLWGSNKEPEDGRGGSVDLYTNYFTEAGKFGFELPPVITPLPLANNSICAGQSFLVPFETTGTFNFDNKYTVLLSDNTGSFDKATEIGSNISKSIIVSTLQGLALGNYKIKIVSSSPTVESKTFDIKIGLVDAPIITSDKLSICAGGNEKVTLKTSSCANGTLKWSNNSTGNSIIVAPIENTVYTATCETIGCKVSDSSNEIKIEAVKLIATASNTGPYFEGELMRLSSSTSTGTAPFKYEWTGPNGFAATAQNPSLLNISVSATGTYSVKITDANNCFGTAQTEVKVNPILANEISIEVGVNVYPNPVSNELRVSFDAQPNKLVNIVLVNMEGQIIDQKSIQSIGGVQQEKFNISNISSGVFLLKVNTSTQEFVKKIVIEN